MKTQVVFIHGGDSFATYEEYLSFLRDFEFDLEYFKKRKWKDGLQEKLGEDFDVIAPQMPNKFNAKYVEWKLWFEKLLPFLNEGVMFVGHSLGGAFLAKYLSENKIHKSIRAIFLVSAPYSIDGERGLVEFTPPGSLQNLEKQCGKIFLYHSKDDPIVVFSELEKYRQALPNAQVKVFKNRGHFNSEEFPEIVEDILDTFQYTNQKSHNSKEFVLNYMRIFRSWTFRWWEVGLIKICLLSLGILFGLYFYGYLVGFLWLWWVLFAATSIYFIVRFMREG